MIPLTQEALFLVAIDALTLNRIPCTVKHIGNYVDPDLSLNEAGVICRKLLGKGLVSFANPGDGDIYVELTSIGDIQVKQLIES